MKKEAIDNPRKLRISMKEQQRIEQPSVRYLRIATHTRGLWSLKMVLEHCGRNSN